MYVITPISVGEAQLLASSIPEPDIAASEVAWNPATTYAVGDRVVRTTTHRVYQALLAGTDATEPELATGGATPRWVDLSATNRYAMFDEYVSSASRTSGSLTVTIAPGAATAIAVLNASANSVRCVVRSGADGDAVYDVTRSFIPPAANWYQFFTTVSEPATQALFESLPLVADQRIELTFSGAAVRVGQVCMGMAYDLGTSQKDVRVGIIDYSSKTVDTFGRTTIVKRGNSRRINLTSFVNNDQLPGVARKLSALAATPAAYVPSAATNLEPLVVFGIFRDWNVVVSYPNFSLLSLEVEGLI